MNEMELILYDISKDAIKKYMQAYDLEQELLFDAAIQILSFSTMMQNKALPTIEDAVNDSALEYFKNLALLVADGIRPELLLEIAANGYWLTNPEGMDAMVYYFYIRGILLIQAGERLPIIEALLGSLIPAEWQDDYKKRITDMKSQNKKESTEDFFDVCPPVFQNTTLLEKLSVLEEELLSLSPSAIQKVLQETDDFILTVCLYGFQTKTRKKIMNNITKRLQFILQEDVICLENIEENDILKEVLHLTAIINRLRESGEI